MSRSTASRSTSGGAAPHGQRKTGGGGNAESSDPRRLVYAPADEFDRWHCRPLGTVDILDVRDRQSGHLDGLVIDRVEDRPMFLVVAKHRDAAVQPPHWFLVPVGEAWFDETERAIRIDADKRERVRFDPSEFERMTPDQADAYERHVLATCCPEVGFHRDGRPDYARLSQFACPTWLRPAGPEP